MTRGTVKEPSCRTRIQTEASPRVGGALEAKAAIVESEPGTRTPAENTCDHPGLGIPIASLHRADVLARCLCRPHEACHRAHAPTTGNCRGRPAPSQRSKT